MSDAPAQCSKAEQTGERQRPLATLLGRNTIFSYLGRFGVSIVALLLTPYVYHKLGVELFGVWALLTVITGYTGLIDMVSPVALTKYVAEARAKNDTVAIHRMASTGLVIHVGLGIAVMGATWVLAGHILTWLKVSPGAHAEARVALLLCVGSACGRRMTSVFGCVLEGLQRLDITNAVRIVIAAAGGIGAVLVLALGYGIVGLALRSAAVWVIEGVILAVLAKRNLPGLRLSLRQLGRHTARRLAVFAVKVQAVTLSGLCMVNTDRLIVGAVLGPASVALYELALRPVIAIHGAVGPIVSPMIPGASHLGAHADRARLRSLFLRASRYTALLSVAGIGLLMAIGPQALRAWIGEVDPKTVSVMYALAAGYMANMLTTPTTGIGYGLGRPEFAVWRGALLVALQLGLGVALVRPFGLPGPAMATTVALVSSSLIYVWLVARHCLGLTMLAGVFRVWLGPLVAGAVPAGAVYGLVQLLDGTGAFQGRLGAAGLVSMGCLSFAALWSGIVLSTGLVTGDDTALLRTAVRSVLGRREAGKVSVAVQQS
ncbi:MAG: oligosaccharide flippase family protein [Armatimonadota bacterium]